jgi:hypothetical protein
MPTTTTTTTTTVGNATTTTTVTVTTPAAAVAVITPAATALPAAAPAAAPAKADTCLMNVFTDAPPSSFPHKLDDVTKEWLSAALGAAVTSFSLKVLAPGGKAIGAPPCIYFLSDSVQKYTAGRDSASPPPRGATRCATRGSWGSRCSSSTLRTPPRRRRRAATAARPAVVGGDVILMCSPVYFV